MFINKIKKIEDTKTESQLLEHLKKEIISENYEDSDYMEMNNEETKKWLLEQEKKISEYHLDQIISDCQLELEIINSDSNPLNKTALLKTIYNSPAYLEDQKN